MKSPKYSANDLLRAATEATELEKSLGATVDTVPKGYRTPREWQRIWGIGEHKARRIIREHVKNGRMTCKMFRQKDATNRTCHIQHYIAVK